MNKIFITIIAMIFSMFMLISDSGNLSAASGLCFSCSSGSSCEQCPSPSGKDTSDDRRACENKGCRITGYSSCSGAANIKYCH